MNKLRVRTVLEILYGVQTEGLARMVGDSGVCGE